MRKSMQTAACFLLAALLAGCAAADNGEAAQPMPTVPAHTPSAQEAVTAGPLYALQGYDGMVYGAAGADGFYYVETVADGGGALRIRYMDYATMQDVPLCAQPNCSHDEESCTAWLPYTGGGASLMVVGETLVLAYPGNVQLQDELGGLCLPHIETANLDGSDRRPLLDLDANQGLCAPYFTDGTDLFIRMTSAEGGTAKSELAKIDLTSGACEPVAELGMSGNEIIWGACGDYLMIRRIEPVETGANVLGGWSNVYLDRLNIHTGERENILQWYDETDRAAVFGSNAIVYDGETNTLRQIDLLSNTVINTVEDFLEPDVSPLSLNLIYFDQGMLLASTWVETADRLTEQTVWHVDMAAGTKAPSEMCQTDPYTGRKIAYLPLAWIEREQSYLVLAGEEPAEPQADNPYLNPTVPHYEKIPAEDFWTK